MVIRLKVESQFLTLDFLHPYMCSSRDKNASSLENLALFFSTIDRLRFLFLSHNWRWVPPKQSHTYSLVMGALWFQIIFAMWFHLQPWLLLCITFSISLKSKVFSHLPISKGTLILYKIVITCLLVSNETCTNILKSFKILRPRL